MNEILLLSLPLFTPVQRTHTLTLPTVRALPRPCVYRGCALVPAAWSRSSAPTPRPESARSFATCRSFVTASSSLASAASAHHGTLGATSLIASYQATGPSANGRTYSSRKRIHARNLTSDFARLCGRAYTRV
eukprot:6213797-Pleurochrysis_carterae.AAC.4